MGCYFVFYIFNWSIVIQKYLLTIVQNSIIGHFHDCFSLTCAISPFLCVKGYWEQNDAISALELCQDYHL